MFKGMTFLHRKQMDWYGNALMEAHNDGMNSDFKKLALF